MSDQTFSQSAEIRRRAIDPEAEAARRYGTIEPTELAEIRDRKSVRRAALVVILALVLVALLTFMTARFVVRYPSVEETAALIEAAAKDPAHSVLARELVRDYFASVSAVGKQVTRLVEVVSVAALAGALLVAKYIFYKR